MGDKSLYKINWNEDGKIDSSSDDDEDENFGEDHLCGNTKFTMGKSNKIIKCLEDLPWFHSGVSRNTAEALLLANGREGTYLLHNSRNNIGKYSISVRCKDSIKHYSLEYNTYTNTYIFGMGHFDTLSELVEHFACMPVLAGESGSSVTLQFPYKNDVPEPCAYEKVTWHAEFGNQNSQVQPDLHIASKEGYLIKRGAIHKNWKKRWFVLQKHLLKYYSDKLSPTPIRSVDLNEATHVIEDFCDNKKNCFRLGLPNRIFYFVASSPHEAKAWIEILQWKIDYYKDRQRDQSDGAVHTSLSSAGNVGEHAAYIAQYTKV